MSEELTNTVREEYNRILQENDEFWKGLVNAFSSEKVEQFDDISGYTSCAACNGTGCDRCMPHLFEEDAPR